MHNISVFCVTSLNYKNELLISTITYGVKSCVLFSSEMRICNYNKDVGGYQETVRVRVCPGAEDDVKKSYCCGKGPQQFCCSREDLDKYYSSEKFPARTT